MRIPYIHGAFQRRGGIYTTLTHIYFQSTNLPLNDGGTPQYLSINPPILSPPVTKVTFMLRMLATLGLGLLVHCALCAQDSVQTLTQTELLTRAYAMIDENPEEAIHLFREVFEHDTTNVNAIRQIGLLYANREEFPRALAALKRANAIMYSDTVALQEAYILNSLGRNREAYSMFEQVRSSPDPGIRKQAEAAMDVLWADICSHSYPWWWRAYAEPYYDTRFSNAIIDGAFRGGYYPGEGRTTSLFGIVAVTRDSRSSGGTAPQIYSDNYILAGGGLRLEPFPGFITDVQLGVAFDLLERPGESATNGDLRVVSSYGNGIYPIPAAGSGLHTSFALFADGYCSLGYYSRYTNLIGDAYIRGGMRVATWNNASLDVYLRGDFTADTDVEFYNNVAEVGCGTRIIPDSRWGLYILLELHRGSYWRTSANPYEEPYTSVQFYIILDKALCF